MEIFEDNHLFLVVNLSSTEEASICLTSFLGLTGSSLTIKLYFSKVLHLAILSCFSLTNGSVKYLLVPLGSFPKNHCLTDCWFIHRHYRPEKDSEKLRLQIALFGGVWSAGNTPRLRIILHEKNGGIECKRLNEENFALFDKFLKHKCNNETQHKKTSTNLTFLKVFWINEKSSLIEETLNVLRFFIQLKRYLEQLQETNYFFFVVAF